MALNAIINVFLQFQASQMARYHIIRISWHQILLCELNAVQSTG
jgi:hypothetical protein